MMCPYCDRQNSVCYDFKCLCCVARLRAQAAKMNREPQVVDVIERQGFPTKESDAVA